MCSYRCIQAADIHFPGICFVYGFLNGCIVRFQPVYI